MTSTIRVFYFELDTGIYVCSENVPAALAMEMLHHFQATPPTSTTTPWGPDCTYAPYGITMSPIEPVKNWKDGEIPVYDRVTKTWHMKVVATPRLYPVESHSFYSGRDIWPSKPSLSLDRLCEKLSKTSDEPCQAWANFFVRKDGFIHHFKNSGSARKDIKQRLKTISEIAQSLYTKWDKETVLAKSNPAQVNPFDYHAHADMLGYHMRRVLDEIASLLFIEIFHPWLKTIGKPLYLDEFALLIKESGGLQELQNNLFKEHKMDLQITTGLSLLQRVFRGNKKACFLEAVRTTNNAAKHAFHNSDSRGWLGTDFPTIVALGKPQGKHQKNGLIEYSHSLPQMLVGFEDYLIDLTVRVSDFRATGEVDLTKPYLTDHHSICKYDDIY